VLRLSKSKGFELLFACILVKRKTEPKPTVAEFASSFGINTDTLPSWTKEAHFNISSVGYPAHFGFNTESAFLNDFLSNLKEGKETGRQLFTGLDHTMRPDAIHLGPIDSLRYFSVLVSNKLYGHDWSCITVH